MSLTNTTASELKLVTSDFSKHLVIINGLSICQHNDTQILMGCSVTVSLLIQTGII